MPFPIPVSPNPLPFLPSQRLYLLRETADPWEAVHPERFRADRPDRDRDAPAAPDEKLWEPLPREALEAGSFRGRPLHCVVFTTDAGMGKTYNALALARAWSPVASRAVRAFPLLIGDLKPGDDLIRDHLAPLVCTDRIVGNTAGDLDLDRLLAEFERMRDRGALALVFDGLDQADASAVRRLAEVTDDDGVWGKCRVVVAGRPVALQRHWTTLFGGKPWKYVQIGEFDASQQRAVLGKLSDGRDRYDAIPKDARVVFTIPRVLEYIRNEVPEDQLASLAAVADVYWRAVRYMLTRALQGQPGRTVDRDDERRYVQLLGALAFSMFAEVTADEAGVARPNTDRVPAGDPLLDFLYGPRDGMPSVLDRMGRLDPGYTKDRLKDDLRTLCSLNALVSHGWIDSDGLAQDDQPLLWRNASLQEFLAAHWVSRWGAPEDHALLRQWVVDPQTDGNRAFYWFWRYATEMPNEVVRPDPRRPILTNWQNAMAPLYAVVEAEKPPVRSTEFIYRSWDRMAGSAAQQAFLAEFQLIRDGKQGADRKAIADRMMDGETVKGKPQPAFIRLVGTALPGDTGHFLMGATDEEDAYHDEKPRHPVTLKNPFALHRYCVTNEEYELFDRRHADHRWTDEPHPFAEKSEGGDSTCPVVNVNWYYAICFARWCGCRLPTEAEWEYACRAGLETPYSVGNGRTLTADVCRFDQDLNRGYTIPVDALGRNFWGLHQMHGNVWEWCADWYDEKLYTEVPRIDPTGPPTGSDRVFRGGGWYFSARFCRSAFRSRNLPGLRDGTLGFRLALGPSGRPSQSSG